MLVLISWVKQCLSSFPTAKLLFFSHFCFVVFGRKLLCIAQIKGVMFHLLQSIVCTKLIGIFLHRKFIYTLICLLIQLFIYICIDSQIFIILWVIIQYFIYFIGSYVFWYTPIIFFLFFFLGTFLLSGTTRCFSLIFFISCLSLRM